MFDMIHPTSTVSARDIVKSLFERDPSLLEILRMEGSKPLADALSAKYHCQADPDWLLDVWGEYYREQHP